MRRSLDYVQMIRGAEKTSSKINTTDNLQQHIHGKSFKKYEQFIKTHSPNLHQSPQNNCSVKLDENFGVKHPVHTHLALNVMLLVIQYLQRKELDRCTTIDKLEKTVMKYRKELSKRDNNVKMLELREKALLKIHCDREIEFEEIKKGYEHKINVLEGALQKYQKHSNQKVNTSTQISTEVAHRSTQTIYPNKVDNSTQTIEMDKLIPNITNSTDRNPLNSPAINTTYTEAPDICPTHDDLKPVLYEIQTEEPPMPPPAPPIADTEDAIIFIPKPPSFLMDIKNLNVDSESRVQAINQIQDQNIIKEPRISKDPLSSIFEEIRKLKPDSENRLKALKAAESARKLDFENNRKIIDKELKHQLGQLKKTGNIDKIEEQRQEKIKELIASIPLVQEYQYDDYDDDDIELMDSSEEETEEEEDGGDLMSMITGFMKPENTKPNIPTLQLPFTNNSNSENELLISPSDDGSLTSMVSNLLKSRPSDFPV